MLLEVAFCLTRCIFYFIFNLLFFFFHDSGRRGVFDGTIENMHLHWKYRELVKVISKDKSFEDVNRMARTLEAESGGILVAVERVSKGHAIIVYRGKNYKRPTDLRPRTLLNKRQAMNRSLEAQRREVNLMLLRLKMKEFYDLFPQMFCC